VISEGEAPPFVKGLRQAPEPQPSRAGALKINAQARWDWGKPGVSDNLADTFAGQIK
jgi:hypothetical protein